MTATPTPKKATPRPKKAAPRTARKQRALVAGVSAYPPPLSKLPAVAADVREVAKLLASPNGSFSSSGVTVLTEKQATRKEVLAQLRATFEGAGTDDTLFVYLAGHGGVENGGYYYLAQDTDRGRLAETGVSLAAIKRLFDRTASRRVFVWLDCCHSGGIIARSKSPATDLSAIRREIGVVQGEGKIIVAACTPAQSAYEDAGLGHGLFTHALLRGLKGEAKNAHGEVTATSLYEFIDREVTEPLQQPDFFGRMTGRIVLMHYPPPGGAPGPAAKSPSSLRPSAAPKAAPVRSVSASGQYLLLNGHIYTAKSATELNDGSWELEVSVKGAEDEAALKSLRGDRFGRGRPVSFAYGNQAFQAEVGGVVSKSAGARSVCSVFLKPASDGNDHFSDMTYNGVTPEEMAEQRARMLLLGEKPPARDAYSPSFTLGPLEQLGVNGAVLPTLSKGKKSISAEFLRQARLWLVYYLKAGKVCDDLLELKLGPERKGGVAVRFRGRRKSRHGNGGPREITVEGVAPY